MKNSYKNPKPTTDLIDSLQSSSASSFYFSSIDAMLNSLASILNTKTQCFSVYNEATSLLTNGASTGTFFGLVMRNSSNYYYVLFRYNSAYIYIGQFNTSGTVTALRRVATESVI